MDDSHTSCVIGNTHFVSRRRVASSVEREKSMTRLMVLSRKGDVAGVQEQLLAGASINDQDSHGYSALFYAVHSHNLSWFYVGF